MRASPLPRPVAALACAIAALGCGGDTSLAIEPACNPLGEAHCMTPWPSAAFELDDPTTATGRRLAIPDGALPSNRDGVAIDPAAWNAADGFSPSAPLIMAWKSGVSPDGLPPSDNFDLSLGDASPTVIIDMTTGARVAHFAEIDALGAAGRGVGDDQGDRQALILRPAERLAGGHRYAVGIARRVRAADGSELATPPGFAALRDRRHTDHALLEAMRPRFADVLDALDDAGYPADELVVAWDFTVASDDFVQRDVRTARDRAVDALAAHAIGVSIAEDERGDDEIRRTLTGSFEAPLFLTQGGAIEPETRLARDADELPALQGFHRVPFVAIVPRCAYETHAAPMVVYAHGFLGSARELTGAVQRATAVELCAVMVGIDLRGTSFDDAPAVLRTLAELSRADEVVEVAAQGVVDHVALVRALRTTLAERVLVDDAGRSVVDAKRVYLDAQGGAMGATLLAYEPTIARGVLGAGAASYATMLERSADWAPYRAFLAAQYPDALDRVLALGLLQMRWDKVEGAGVAHVALDGAAGGAAKQVMMQVALGDEQVPNLASDWLARTMGVPVLGPTPRTPWGMTVQMHPTGSAMQIFDGGAPRVPAGNVPPRDRDAHQLIRRSPAARRAMKQFFDTGALVNACLGPCVCLHGACE